MGLNRTYRCLSNFFELAVFSILPKEAAQNQFLDFLSVRASSNHKRMRRSKKDLAILNIKNTWNKFNIIKFYFTYFSHYGLSCQSYGNYIRIKAYTQSSGISCAPIHFWWWILWEDCMDDHDLGSWSHWTRIMVILREALLLSDWS